MKKKIAAQKTISQNAAKLFDVVIIGGGAAGMSAALWCDELGLATLLLEENKELGGQLLRVFNPIKNHLGADAGNGQKLQKIFLRQIKSRKFSIQARRKIVKTNFKRKSITLNGGEQIKWQFLVIATGVRRRTLGVEGEDKFKDHGILESGKRDAKLIKNKRAAIIGGGDAALENALILAKTAAEVTVIHHRENLRARAEFTEKARKNKKIKILTETIVTKFSGGKELESLELNNLATEEVFVLPVEAALLRIGVAPNTEIFRDELEMDTQGYIKINENCETSVENVLAIGDVANPLSPTISSAVGMGATAAKVIFSRLNSKS